MLPRRITGYYSKVRLLNYVIVMVIVFIIITYSLKKDLYSGRKANQMQKQHLESLFLSSENNQNRVLIPQNEKKLNLESSLQQENRQVNSEMTSNCVEHMKRFGRYPRIANTLLTDFYPDLADRFQGTVDQKLPADSEEVVDLVKIFMDYPVDKVKGQQMKLSNHIHHTPQSDVVQQYYKEKGLERGFFIECGALDGERSSNTIYLERFGNWSGLLIEADPWFYTQILGKRRHAYSINVCLSPSNYTMWAHFAGSHLGGGKLTDETLPGEGEKPTIRVPCFPLESLLLAIGQNRVDYFSLDVEGVEMSILKSIPYHKLDIASWTIEYSKDVEEQNKMLQLMQTYGYRLQSKIRLDSSLGLSGFARDFFFVKD